MGLFGKGFACTFLFAGIAFSLSACSKPTQDSEWPGPNDPVPQKFRSTNEECQDFVDNLPSTYMHGTVDVPENPNDPKSPMVRIFYYGPKMSGQTPIVFFNGGPTSDSHSSYRALNDSRFAVASWANAPMIYIDQRGNGCSSGYPQGNSDEVLTRLKYYDSSAIVSDAEAVRKKLLGSRPWKVFGQSFGAWIAHRYVAQAPESIVGAFAHANAITDDSIARMSNRILAQNRVLSEYLNQYPDDRRRLEILHESLSPDSCFPNRAAQPRRCGLATISPLLTRFGFVPRWPWVHDWLKALVVFNPTNNPNGAPRTGQIDIKMMNDFLKKVVFSKVDDPKNDKYWAEQIIDHYDRNSLNFDHSTCEKIYAELSSHGEQPATYLLHECMVAMQFTADNKSSKDRLERLARFDAANGNDYLTLESVKAGLAKMPSGSLYVYSGRLDVYVPVENFQLELQQLGSLIRYYNFTNSGHDGFYSEPRVAKDVLGL